MPVTPQNMSYVSVVSGALVLFVVSLWFTTKRGVFTGPKIDIELLTERRNAAIHGQTIAAVEVPWKADSVAGASEKEDKVEI